MLPLLEWIENSAVSTALRDSPNVFLYPTILAFHTLGLAVVVGFSSAVALRILGVAPALPLPPLRKFFPLMWVGFWVNATSGVLLLLIEPTKFLTMVDFYFKLLAIVGAVFCMRWLYRRVFLAGVAGDASLPPGAKFVSALLLGLWLGAITGGRLTAYDDTHTQWVTAIATLVVSAVLLALGWAAVRVWRIVHPMKGEQRHGRAVDELAPLAQR